MTNQSETKPKLVLCPYCGHAQHGGERCEDCGGLFEPLSRRATQLAMGPWQVRDKHNPFRPGCCYDVVKKMAASGKLKPTSVMRGPTTRQFWSIARNVPGVAHLIGYCHACGHHVSPSDAKCGGCGAAFEAPRERDVLGLIYKTDLEAQRGQAALDAEVRGEAPPPPPMPGPTKRPPTRRGSGQDLLSEVLDLSGDIGPPAAGSGTPGAVRGGGSGGVTRPAPAGVRQPGPVAKPIDFTPPAQPNAPRPAPASAFDVEPTRGLPESGGMSGKAWLLLAANIIAIATIIILFLFRE